MKISIGLSAPNGRVGRQLVALLEHHPKFRLGKCYQRPERVSMEQIVQENAAIIDFSSPACLQRVLDVMLNDPKPLLIGTTLPHEGAFRQELLEKMALLSQKAPILFTVNTSFWSYVQKKIAEKLAEIPNVFGKFTEVSGNLPDWDVLEVHHRAKEGRMSGSAKDLLQTLKNQGVQDVGFSSQRRGKGFSLQTLTLTTDEEELSLTHRVMDTKIYARNALLLAAWLLQQPKGLYHPEDCFDEIFK